MANSTSATFLRVVGSELIQKYLGDGPKLVRELFRIADEMSPSIVFIDEIDAIGTKARPATVLTCVTIRGSRTIGMRRTRCWPDDGSDPRVQHPPPPRCPQRYDANSGGEKEIQRTMLELLNQLDGFDAMGDVKVRG